MKVSIVSAKTQNKLNDTGQIAPFTVYTFTVDKLGPFSYQTPLEDDTPDNLAAAIKARIDILQSV